MKEKMSTKILKGIGVAVLLFIALFPIYWLLAMGIRETDEMRGALPPELHHGALQAALHQ